MKRVSALAFLLPAFLASHASAITINDPSALPPVENGNGFISSSTGKARDFVSVSPLIPVNQESDVKFGFRPKSIQPHHVPPLPERRGPALLPGVDNLSEQKPFLLKHNPSLLPKEEVPVSSIVPIIPVSHVPVLPQQPIIPAIEGQVPVEQNQHIPHKSKHRRPHVPKHQRKHVPHVPKQRCECPIPIIPDNTKPKRRHHVPKHARKTEKRQHILYPNEDKL